MLALKKEYTLKKYIAHALLIAITFIFIIAFFAGIFIEKRDAKMKRIDRIYEAHETLMSIIAPELAISNVMEIRKLLSLSSSKDLILAVIDNDRNIYMSDYEHLGEIKKLLLRSAQVRCSELNGQAKKLKPEYFFYCSSIYYQDKVSDNSLKLGVLVSYNTLDSTFHSWSLVIKTLVAFLTMFILFFIFIRRELHKRLLSPLIKLERQLDKIDYANLQENTDLGDIGWAPVEICKIKKSFIQLLGKLHSENIRIRDVEKKATLSNLSVQIAHDIRSPLAALKELLSEMKNIPEKTKLLANHAINRINDIANNLLTQYRFIQNHDKMEEDTRFHIELVSSLIDMVISEKRLQFSQQKIEISFTINEKARSVFVNINPSLFKRVISNILNNAIESIQENGQVCVYLDSIDKDVLIQISDNGCGIPESLLPLLGNGASYGKTNGSGLGLSTAIEKIQSWGGSLTVQSKEQQGTCVKIFLPLARTPIWFAEKVFFNKNIKKVFVIDDEASVYQIWNNRFEKTYKHFSCEVIHFYNPIEFIDWYRNNSSDLYESLFFVDFQFENFKINGVELVRECHIEANSFIVSSCYEAEHLRESCLRLGVKLLPKFFASYVPIELTENLCVDLIFLDDDPLITNTWELSCSLKKIDLKTFNEVDIFLDKIMHYSKLTPIYIDSDLNHDLKGEEIARCLYMIGYRGLHLVTGKSKEDFSGLYWIQSINNKQVPQFKE